MAMLDTTTLYMDSPVAVRAFAAALVAQEAAAIPNKESNADSVHRVTWLAAHMGDDVSAANLKRSP